MIYIINDGKCCLWQRSVSGKNVGGVMLVEKKYLIIEKVVIGESMARVKIVANKIEHEERLHFVEYFLSSTNAWTSDYHEIMLTIRKCYLHGT